MYDPDGNWVDLCGMDNVLENNILDCFEDVSAYFEYVDMEMNNSKPAEFGNKLPVKPSLDNAIASAENRTATVIDKKLSAVAPER